jgi:fatty acid desaturase
VTQVLEARAAEAGARKDPHKQEYQALYAEVRAAGLLKPDTWGYVRKFGFVLLCYIPSYVLLLSAESFSMRLLLAALVAFVSIQSAGIAHEAGHGAVSASARVTRAVGQVCMTLLMGSSFESWLSKHREHHGHPNTRRDPDMRSGVFSFDEEYARNSKGLSNWLIRHQPEVIWPLASLMGFAFKLNSIKFLLKRAAGCRIDWLLMLSHAAIWLVLPSLLIGAPRALTNYLLITWLEGVYLSTIFITNHLGRPAELAQWRHSFMGRQAVAARNLPDSWLLRHFFLGLNSHIEHHLFSHMSFTRLHQAREITERYCRRLGIPYHSVSVRGAFFEVQHFHQRMARAASETEATEGLPREARL